MCNRYSFGWNNVDAASAFMLSGWADVPAFWNIAPSATSAVIALNGAGERECFAMRWGLVPGWAKDEMIGQRTTNARSETAHEKPSFRESLEERRCVVPADGFYEWQDRGGVKRPYRVAPRCGLMAFAGLWDEWVRPEGELLRTFTILTTSASDDLIEYHERMPVMLRVDAVGEWMDGSRDGREALGFALGDGREADLDVYRVSKRVNSVRNQGRELIERIDEAEIEEGEQGELW
ncbi:MAG: SOS response-associated peptidase [Planctomycetota bacterium]|jgi:putative SOS response-associated peptidase YedK